MLGKEGKKEKEKRGNFWNGKRLGWRSGAMPLEEGCCRGDGQDGRENRN